MTDLEFDSRIYGDLLKGAPIGAEVKFLVTGRVSKIEANIVDVNSYSHGYDALHGEVAITVHVTKISEAE